MREGAPMGTGGSGGLGAAFREAPAEPAEPAEQAGPVRHRLDGLERAVAEGRGRLDDVLLDDVAATVERATGRLRLSTSATVVAIAGATGSGKSTTFNALAGADLSTAGAQRPTTSRATALVWSDDEDAAEVTALLDWLDVPEESRFRRAELATCAPRGSLPEGLVLLDLPDHDSIRTAHHDEAERVVALADALIWVVDPQKYADAAIHQRFLRPLAGHRDVTMVVLNHLDTVPEEVRPDLLRDLRKVLVADGMRDPRILGVSARHGLGIDELRTAIVRRVEENRNAERRALADVSAAAERLRAASGDASGTIPDVWVADLERRVAQAAGARRRGPVDRSAVNAAVRSLADDLTRDLTPAWGAPVRAAATAHLDRTADRLDAELAALPEPAPASRSGGQAPGPWALARAAGLVAAAAGLVLLVTGAGTAAGAALLAAGVALALGAHFAGRTRGADADLPEARADDESGRVIARVLRAQVLDPVRAELASYGRFRAGLDRAGTPRAGR
ncbi:dynamin family protein [Pimelobacter simplex]|uniref:dynamin family protein n=1 Tax=Nocardioides simplex TaxID=2045 RepID=UPI003AAE5981